MCDIRVYFAHGLPLIDPNPAVIVMKDQGGSLVLLKQYKCVDVFIHINILFCIHKHNQFVLIFIDRNQVKSTRGDKEKNSISI